MPQETHATTASEAHDKPNILKPEPGLAIWTVVTFVLLLVILKKLAWGPMLDNLDKRANAIKDALSEAEKAREQASSQLEEQQKILQEARKEAQELIARSRSDAERSGHEIVAKAREDSEKVVEAGRQAIEQERRAAIQEIRQTAVDLALGASEKLLNSRIDDSKSRELVSSYIDQLEGDAGKDA